MPMRLQGKVAIVTGAGRGIGRATALALAREGAQVVLVARSRAEIDAVAAETAGLGGQALPLVADVAEEADVIRMVAQALQTFGRVDILVNNAGVSVPFRDVADFRLEDWNRILQVNLTGTFLCSRAVLPAMIRQGGGKIVNLGSLSSFVGFPGNSAYAASKAGIVMFTKCLAAEVKRHGIDVNAVCPSGTDTRLLEEIGLKQGRTNLIRPEEIAALVLFLATAEASAITGTAIEAYGQSNPLFSGMHPSKPVGGGKAGGSNK
jgi:NAD(P)-dependent dehydrogenase (short-subunit alcohol dehydrogenase family)